MTMPGASRSESLAGDRPRPAVRAKLRAALAATVLAFPLLVPAAALAQAGGGVPVPTREELDRTDTSPADPAAGGPRLSVEGGVEHAPCALAAPRFADVRMTISGAEFANLQGLPAEALAPAWQDYVGREVPVATVCDIRDRATTLLRRAGYVAAVQVPPQRIEKNGVLRFDVLMARLVRVQIRGDAGNSEKLIAGHLETLKNQPVFNIREAERHLLLLQDLPGYEVRLTLRPAGTVPGEVVGEVRVFRQRVRLDANLQNLGSRQVGRWGALARLQVNDITGLGDSTVLSLFNTLQTDEQTVLQAGHSFALGNDGLRLSGDFTYGWARPDVLNGAIRSRTLIAGLGLSYPIVRRQSLSLMGTAGFEMVNQNARFGTTPLLRDRVRVIYARVAFETIDTASLLGAGGYSAATPEWRLSGILEARQGIDMLGGSDRCVSGAICLLSRPALGTDPTAFVMRGQGVAEHRPVPFLSFSLKPRFQYSGSSILSYEQFSAGNFTVGRGYDPGALLGDSGVGLSAEAAYGRTYPTGPDAFAFQPFAFFDGAWTWTRAATGDPQKLFSAGAGIRGAWGNKVRFDLTAAIPLKRVAIQPRRGDARILLSISTALIPWSF